MASALVIGCGNSLRQDDGAGYCAAEQLNAAEFKSPVRVIACQQLTPDLASEMSNVDRVVLIDATAVGSPGDVLVQKVEPPDRIDTSITHELQPGALLEAARALFHSNAEMYLVTITGESFDFGAQLSRTVQAAMPEVYRRVIQLLGS
ncbi:MAG TPA: hydrogenase maturation protease [Candidatus Acidoferrales bacterium]|nr:hydrogenase maturation protease [Candidatus Acidoferrales bacterium]